MSRWITIGFLIGLGIALCLFGFHLTMNDTMGSFEQGSRLFQTILLLLWPSSVLLLLNTGKGLVAAGPVILGAVVINGVLYAIIAAIAKLLVNQFRKGEQRSTR